MKATETLALFIHGVDGWNSLIQQFSIYKRKLPAAYSSHTVVGNFHYGCSYFWSWHDKQTNKKSIEDFFPALCWTKVVLTLKALIFTIHKQNDCATVSDTKGTSKS